MNRTTTKIKSAMVRARIEPGLKTKAEKYFDILGLSTMQAITLFSNKSNFIAAYLLK